jgi:CBS domain-containing protein
MIFFGVIEALLRLPSATTGRALKPEQRGCHSGGEQKRTLAGQASAPYRGTRAPGVARASRATAGRRTVSIENPACCAWHSTCFVLGEERKEATVKVRELMTREPLSVSLDTPVVDARRTMLEHRFRHLLVTDGGRLAGIITDRDIRLNLPSPATSLSVWEINYLLARMTVASVMTTGVITVDPDRDAVEAARIMLDHKIGALPVVDGGKVVGIMTETDILRAFATMASPVLATR